MAKKKKTDISVKDDVMVPVTVGLTILGKPMSKIAKMLELDRATVKKYLDSQQAKKLIEPFKELILILHGRAVEVLTEDLNYKGTSVQRLQIRSKTAMAVLKAAGVLPKEGKGDTYIAQQNTFSSPQEIRDIQKLLGIDDVEVMDLDDLKPQGSE